MVDKAPTRCSCIFTSENHQILWLPLDNFHAVIFYAAKSCRPHIFAAGSPLPAISNTVGSNNPVGAVCLSGTVLVSPATLIPPPAPRPPLPIFHSTKYRGPAPPASQPLWKQCECKESPGWNGLYYYIMDCIIDHLLYTLYGQEGLVGGGGLVTMMDHCAKYPPSVSTSNTLPGHTATTVTTAAGTDTCLQNMVVEDR